jgi:hypothetical protein
MRIDQYYSNMDKANFYLGMISQVYRGNSSIQVENLSLLNHRKLRLETLIPNTINYFVVVDSVQGLFLGEIYQSKVNSSDSVHESMNNGRKDNVFPEISVNIIGLLSDDVKFKLSGFKTVGITDKVYIANEKIIHKYIESIEINTYLNDTQKQPCLNNLAKIGNFDLEYLSLQPNTLFDRHLMAIGTTNSGKSTSALSILDKMINSKRKILLIDPTGEYKSSFDNCEMLSLTLGKDTVLPIGKISMRQWSMIFQTNDGTQDTVLTKAVKSLRFQFSKQLIEPKNPIYTGIYKKVGKTVTQVDTDMSFVTNQKGEGAFELSLLPEQIIAESVIEGTKSYEKGLYKEDTFRSGINGWLAEKVENVLENSTLKDFFSSELDKHNLIAQIDEFLSNDSSSLYIDASEIGTLDGIGAMIVDLISHYVINKKRSEIKPFVMYIDEVHRYTQSNNEYQSGLVSIAREGRKKGIFLFLTTQSPKDVPEILLGQVGTLIIHRLTHSEELRTIQNQVQQNTLSQIQKLNQGEAVLTSINLLQDVYVRFEKCKRSHESNTPIL